MVARRALAVTSRPSRRPRTPRSPHARPAAPRTPRSPHSPLPPPNPHASPYAIISSVVHLAMPGALLGR